MFVGCNINWRSRKLKTKEVVAEFPFYLGGPSDYRSVQDMCRVIRHFSWGEEWIAAAKTYFDGLSGMTDVVHDYTHRGDRLVNMWLRGDAQGAVNAMRQYDTFPFMTVARNILDEHAHDNRLAQSFFVDPPLSLDYRGELVFDPYQLLLQFDDDIKTRMTDEFLLRVIAEAARLLAETIQNAPPLPRDVLLFRGVKTDLFDHGDTLVSRGFVSASNSGVVAAEFAGNDGFVLRLHVPKGTHCLPAFGSMYEDELEVILAPGSVLLKTGCQDLREKDIQLCNVKVLYYRAERQAERQKSTKRKFDQVVVEPIDT